MKRRDIPGLLVAAATLPLPAVERIKRIDPPAGPDSGMPFLTTSPDGSVLLAWTDAAGSGSRKHMLRFSRWTGSAWTAPETIAQGSNWFINWADFGSVSILRDDSMLAHWLDRARKGGQYGYGIRIARREANRPQWREIHGMSLDEKEDYAGFLSFAPHTGAAVYLSPPGKNEHHAATSPGSEEHSHRKTARFIEFRPDGSVARDQEIDADVCSCCQTAIGRTRGGWIVTYRDRSPKEIRDISVTRFMNGSWTAPQTIHADGWEINGCPTDGPSLATAGGDHVAIAWLTRAGGTAKIQAVLSNDQGARFGEPIRIDEGNALGRPALTVFDDTSYLVTWLEKAANGAVDIRLRHISSKGTASQPLVVAQAPTGRAAGFPKVAVNGSQILVTWRDERVRAALLDKQHFKKSRSA